MLERRVKATVAALAAAVLLAACGGSGDGDAGAGGSATAASEGWAYTDGSGKTVSLDAVPTRIVAHASAAAALLSMGIRSVGIYADVPVRDDPMLSKLDLDGIEIVGETWGEIDIERVLSLRPDLIVAEWWPLEKAYSGLEADVSEDSKKLPEIAPIVGVAQGTSLLRMLKDYEQLAASLGADLEAPGHVQAKTAFEGALSRFRAATAAKPDLTVLAVSPTKETLYVAAPEGAAELNDFAEWGLRVMAPEVADDRGYWETLSWENADKYQADLLLVDDRMGPSTLQTARAQPTWTSIRAAAAGAVTDWPAFWIRTYGAYAEELEQLTAAVHKADEHLVR